MEKRVAVAVIGTAALVVGLGFAPAWGAAGGANTATVCRITGDGTTAAALQVNEHAVAAFLRQGNSVPGDTVVGTNNEYIWTPQCIALPKKVFAIAYSNVDGIPGYNPSPRGGDVLIAKLFDDNNDGHLSPGDKINTFKYPLTYTPHLIFDFGSFQVTQHTVTVIDEDDAIDISVQINDGHAQFFHGGVASSLESYIEGAPPFDNDLNIEDVGIGLDTINVPASAPSDPTTPVHLVAPGGNGTDDAFINVEINP